MKYSRIRIFYIRDFHEASCFSGLLQVFEIFFELNDYFLFTRTTSGSVKVKISNNSEQKLFLGFFFQNPLNFPYRLANLLATKVNQIQKFRAHF
jgi:hypothetical protein